MIELKVIKRDRTVADFTAEKIRVAVQKAYIAVRGTEEASTESGRATIQSVLNTVLERLEKQYAPGTPVDIESIQDKVEIALMANGLHDVARAYILYREEHKKQRNIIQQEQGETVQVEFEDGIHSVGVNTLSALMKPFANGLDRVNVAKLADEVMRTMYNGIKQGDMYRAIVLAGRAFIEYESQYSKFIARVVRQDLHLQATGHFNEQSLIQYNGYFQKYIQEAIEAEILNPELATFDLALLAAHMKAERDDQFEYLGMTTLIDRYFIHIDGRRIELPQAFFMRVAMGIALAEKPEERNQRAIEFYDVLSSFDYMTSTPTLFNSGTRHSQLSSCYLTTIADDLDGIYEGLKEDALLSKFAGGIGNDWTSVRSMGAHIKGTNGKSQGVVPFLKVANDTAVAVNQCFDRETYVYTSNGLKTIDAINTNDMVLTEDGVYRKVTHTFEYSASQHDVMHAIDTKHSFMPVKVTSGHPFYGIKNDAMDKSLNRVLPRLEKGQLMPSWIDASELKEGDLISFPIPQEIVPVANFTKDDAFLYGIMLGDGHITKEGREYGITFHSTNDEEHYQFVIQYLTSHDIHYWITESQVNHSKQVHWSQNKLTPSKMLPFDEYDLYNEKHEKRIAPRLAHLPLEQSLQIIRGCILTDGNVSRGKEITFCNTSYELIESIRYQLLRHGVPTAGNKRVRSFDHDTLRKDNTITNIKGENTVFDLRIPAVSFIADMVDCKPLTKKNWIVWNNRIYSRVKSNEIVATSDFVYDLKVEGIHSYVTTNGLVHNGGKRKGAICAYLETWHADIEEFLELRKNTGDDRRRTHDMNTANWIPDLFMERVISGADWSLFSPNEVPELHDLYGNAFRAKYEEYEALGKAGKLRVYKSVPALSLWRKMLTMLFETGHPWINFKDPCNLRSPQQHAGVVHSSNLCTEITLNTNEEEIAVCNLGSVNLVQHVRADGSIDADKVAKTIKTAVRMLDNVIDVNFYPVKKAEISNKRHRPVGLGMMGLQEVLYIKKLPFESAEAIQFNDELMELIAYHAYLASSTLAAERGAYPSYDGSLWSKGVLPQDSMRYLAEHRSSAEFAQLPEIKERLNWSVVREHIAKHGMRNSNVIAIAPTATISNIIGVSASFEPQYQNLYVKSNLSGEFTIVNEYLMNDLRALGLYDDAMIADLKYFEGSVQNIERVPQHLKDLYRTSFEMDPIAFVEGAARRQIWIDQAQSLNIYMAGASGKKIDALYKHAWLRGLKTTYYLRTLGASSAEKSTGRGGELNAVQAQPVAKPVEAVPATDVKFCSIDNPDCESCQ